MSVKKWRMTHPRVINGRQDTASMMTRTRKMNGRHVLMLGSSMCMINERHCYIIGIYDY